MIWMLDHSRGTTNSLTALDTLVLVPLAVLCIWTKHLYFNVAINTHLFDVFSPKLYYASD